MRHFIGPRISIRRFVYIKYIQQNKLLYYAGLPIEYILPTQIHNQNQPTTCTMLLIQLNTVYYHSLRNTKYSIGVTYACRHSKLQCDTPIITSTYVRTLILLRSICMRVSKYKNIVTKHVYIFMNKYWHKYLHIIM